MEDREGGFSLSLPRAREPVILSAAGAKDLLSGAQWGFFHLIAPSTSSKMSSVLSTVSSSCASDTKL